MTVPVLIQAVLLVLTVFCVVGWKRVGCCPLQHNIMSPCVAKMSPLSFNECFVLMRILFDTACWLLFESPCCLFLEMASKCLSENLWLSRHNSALSGVRGRPTVWAWRVLRCHMCVLVGLVRVLVVPPQTLITPYSNILLFQRTHPPSDMNSPHLPRSNDVLCWTVWNFEALDCPTLICSPFYRHLSCWAGCSLEGTTVHSWGSKWTLLRKRHHDRR